MDRFMGETGKEPGIKGKGEHHDVHGKKGGDQQAYELSAGFHWLVIRFRNNGLIA